MYTDRAWLWLCFPCLSVAAPASAQIGSGTATVSSVTPAGAALASVLDSSDVENLWLASVHVAWYSGEPNGAGGGTHCSAFVAAIAEWLGVFLPRPPPWSAGLLSNAQADWLASQAAVDAGWQEAADKFEAQIAANEGALTVVSYRNPDTTQSGHIAIVRPHVHPEDSSLPDGPQVAQAGGTNKNSASQTAKWGFGTTKLNAARYFVFRRGSAAPLPAYHEWSLPGAVPPVRFLVDSTPEGRLNAFKLDYNTTAYKWHTPAAWLQGATEVPTGVPPVVADYQWYKYSIRQSTPSGNEPWFKSTIPGSWAASMRFEDAQGDALSLAEGGGGHAALDPAVDSAVSGATGLYYARQDDANMWGLFLTRVDGTGAAGYALSYQEDLSPPGASTRPPRWKRFDAPWDQANVYLSSAAVIKSCALVGHYTDNNEDCESNVSPNMIFSITGMQAVLEGAGLEVANQAVAALDLQKATVA